MSTAPSPLTLDQLQEQIASGQVDTVLVAATDMQGRLQGKRITARFFIDEVMDNGTEGCSYLLAADVEMNTIDGYALTSWERGYGDFMFVPDYSTLRHIPWHPGTVMVQCDLAFIDGSPMTVSPRQVLKAQLERLDALGFSPIGATELEFALYNTSYRDAMAGEYRNLEAASTYNIDYSLFGTGQVEGYLHRLRTEMDGAGLYTESAKGECNLGQLEVGFRYADILSTCDNHVVYKLGAKQIADQEGKSVTFMAKPNEREGSSCHIHLSLNDSEGKPAFPTGHGTEMSETMKHFVAGVVDTQFDFTYLYAPNINSYKRFADGALSVMGPGCASNSESPEPTQTPTSRARPSSPPASTGWRTSSSCPRRSPATPTPRTCRTFPAAFTTLSPPSTPRRWPGTHSVTRSSTTTRTPGASKWPPSTRP